MAIQIITPLYSFFCGNSGVVSHFLPVLDALPSFLVYHFLSISHRTWLCDGAVFMTSYLSMCIGGPSKHISLMKRNVNTGILRKIFWRSGRNISWRSDVSVTDMLNLFHGALQIIGARKQNGFCATLCMLYVQWKNENIAKDLSSNKRYTDIQYDHTFQKIQMICTKSFEHTLELGALSYRLLSVTKN